MLSPLTAPPLCEIGLVRSLHFAGGEIDSERGSNLPKVTRWACGMDPQAIFGSSAPATSPAPLPTITHFCLMEDQRMIPWTSEEIGPRFPEAIYPQLMTILNNICGLLIMCPVPRAYTLVSFHLSEGL